MESILKCDISGSYTALLIFSHHSPSLVKPSMLDWNYGAWQRAVKLPETSHSINIITSEKACLCYTNNNYYLDAVLFHSSKCSQFHSIIILLHMNAVKQPLYQMFFFCEFTSWLIENCYCVSSSLTANISFNYLT